MFKIINLSTNAVYYIDSPRYVKLNDNGVWIRCEEQDAQCLAIDGQRFSIQNRPQVEDAPETVIIRDFNLGDDFTKYYKTLAQSSGDIEEIKAALLNLCDTVLDWYTELSTKN